MAAIVRSLEQICWLSEAAMWTTPCPQGKKPFFASWAGPALQSAHGNRKQQTPECGKSEAEVLSVKDFARYVAEYADDWNAAYKHEQELISAPFVAHPN
jgi:hypothetical protein